MEWVCWMSAFFTTIFLRRYGGMFFCSRRERASWPNWAADDVVYRRAVEKVSSGEYLYGELLSFSTPHRNRR